MSASTSLRRTRALCVFTFASTVALHAQTLQFDADAGTSQWTTPSNWSSNTLPGASHMVNLNGHAVQISGAASVAGLRNYAADGSLAVEAGGNLTVGSGHVNIGAQGLALTVNAGTVTAERIFTNATVSGSAGHIVLKGGALNVTNRITLSNTHPTNGRSNGFSISGGALSVGTSGFTLFGAASGDRAFLEVIGSAGAFTSPGTRRNVTLANVTSGVPAETAASVDFALTDASVTTIYAANLVLANNPLSIDFTNVSLPVGSYSYTLFDYDGALTGTFAPPSYSGLNGRTASFAHQPIEKRFVITLTVPPSPPGPTESDPIAVSDFELPPQNAQGWTILTPSSTSRIVYVDPVSGNDSTGTFYAPNSSVIGSDPQSPAGTVRAYRTIAAAATQLRHDQPDWILLRAGRVFNESLQIKRGASATERAVAAVYGTGARPELRTGASHGIAPNRLVNVIVQGIRFWAHTREPGPTFVNYAGGMGFRVYTDPVGNVNSSSNILIEDCVFRSYVNNSINTTNGPTNANGANQAIVRFVLRRSIISGNYADAPDKSQGLNYYSRNTSSTLPEVLLQENVFDHNGWRIQQTIPDGSDKSGGQATVLNHNTYFVSAKNVLFVGNIFSRASSIGNKFSTEEVAPGEIAPGAARSIVVADNLYLEGELGISIGGNVSSPRRFRDVVIRDNVFSDIGRTRPTNRELAFYLDIQDWDGGEIKRNLLIHQRHPGITNAYAMLLKNNTGGATRDVVISGNVISDFRSSNSGVVRLTSPATTTNVLFADNIVHASNAARLVTFSGGGYSFAGTNRYYSSAAANSRFTVNGSAASLATWINATGDSDAVWGAPSFPAATRDVETYMGTLQTTSTPFATFINVITHRERGVWNPALTAPVINDWLRAGFGMPANPN